MPSGIQAGAGLPKEQVNYRHHEQCSTCTYFYPLNSCRKVSGNISPEAVCDLYELVEKSNYRPNKDFMKKEYEKSGGTDWRDKVG